MSASTLQLRVATLDDLSGLVQLFQRHYNQYKPEAYFAWQYFRAVHPVTLIVAQDVDNKIVGSFGAMVRPMSRGLLAAQAMDLLLDEAHRGQGAFARMAELAFDALPEVDVRIVLSNPAGTAAVTRTLGWSRIARVPVWSLGGALPVERLASAPNPEPLKIIYSPEDLEWRFAAHPFNRHQKLEAQGVLGFVKLFVDPLDEAQRFGDVLYLSPASVEAQSAWLTCAAAWFAENKVSTWGLWSLPGTPVAAAAARAGLSMREQERWLCAQVVAERFENNDLLTEPWDVCAADAEFY